MGSTDQGPRHLPRSGALFARPLRQGERPALALAHAAARDSLGRALPGTPVSDCPGPPERYWQEHKPGRRQHKRLTDWGGQVLIQAALWLPHRRIIGIGDASFAAIDLLN